jgi:hypothetical protein
MRHGFRAPPVRRALIMQRIAPPSPRGRKKRRGVTYIMHYAGTKEPRPGKEGGGRGKEEECEKAGGVRLVFGMETADGLPLNSDVTMRIGTLISPHPLTEGRDRAFV